MAANEDGWSRIEMGSERDLTATGAVERAELTGEYDPAVCGWRKEVVQRLRYRFQSVLRLGALDSL